MGAEVEAAWAQVVGQPDAVAALRAAAADPVHAYLLVGRRGTGTRAAARAFAADLLARSGTDPARDVQLVLAERHPDVVVFEPEGRTLRTAEAQSLVLEASRSPVEGDRKVIVCTRFHTAEPEAAASLLKTIEEPPATAVFVLLAEEVPLEHVTIASRCVTVGFAPLTDAVVAGALEADGVAPDVAAIVADAAHGDLDRARLLVADDAFLARREAWWSLPEQLDGTGATVARLVDDLRARIDAAQAPLDERHRRELSELAAAAELTGQRAGLRKQVEERHRREARFLRDDELRFGLSVLARRMRDRAVASPPDPAAVEALERLRRAAEALERNPNEALLLQHLLRSLPPP